METSEKICPSCRQASARPLECGECRKPCCRHRARRAPDGEATCLACLMSVHVVNSDDE